MNYTYNNAGQGTSVAKGACPGANCYAYGLAYTPHGAMASGTFGQLTPTFGALSETHVYNSRLQLTDLTAATATGPWVMHNEYGTMQNNGNLLSQTVNATAVGGVIVT